jgi:hypothetical protein
MRASMFIACLLNWPSLIVAATVVVEQDRVTKSILTTDQPLPACGVFYDFEWVESTQRVMIPDRKRGSIQDMEIGGFARP